jgi:hypothetical protein
MNERLKTGDRILLCGKREARDRMHHTLHDPRALYYTRTGIDRPDGALWRLLTGRRAESCGPEAS